VAASKHARDRDDALQMEADEIGARFLSAPVEHDARDVGVVDAIERLDAPKTVDIGNRFDVECEDVHRAPSVLHEACNMRERTLGRIPMHRSFIGLIALLPLAVTAVADETAPTEA